MRKLYAIYETAVFIIKDKDGRLVAHRTHPRASDKGLLYRYTDKTDTTVLALYEDVDDFERDYPYCLEKLYPSCLARYCDNDSVAFYENKDSEEFTGNGYFRFAKNEFISVTIYQSYKEVDDKAPDLTLTKIMSNLSIDEFLLYVKDRMDKLK